MPLHALIDRAALRANLQALRSAAPKSKLMAVVKANAYGHGIKPALEALAEAATGRLVQLWQEGFGEETLGEMQQHARAILSANGCGNGGDGSGFGNGGGNNGFGFGNDFGNVALAMATIQAVQGFRNRTVDEQ